MSHRIRNRVAFAGKSLLWSLLLYVAVMLVINWDEVSNTVTGKNTIAVAHNVPAQQMPDANNPASISRHAGVGRSIMIIIRTISGLASVAAAG